MSAAKHACDSGNFDRAICPEPCGMMHSYCTECGTRADRCAHDAAIIRDTQRSAALDRVVAENTALRAKVARVEALADEWEREEMPDPTTADIDLRAALEGDR